MTTDTLELPAAAATTEPMAPIDKVVAGYIALRDKKAQIKARHDAELAPIKAMLDKAEVFLLGNMQKQGVKSYRTDGGTAYIAERSTASAANWDELLTFIRDHGLWQLLERRVNKTAVDEYRREHDDLPPAVNYRTETVVNVRRS